LHRAATTLQPNVASRYHCNQQYSITAITSSTGAVQERYAYTAYGVPSIANASGTLLTASAISNRYTYTGREWDNDIRQYHYRARMYDASLGRFCGRDPIGYKAGDLCVYRFVFSQPTNRLDPSGLESWIPFPRTSSGCVINPITGQRICDPPPPPPPPQNPEFDPAWPGVVPGNTPLTFSIANVLGMPTSVCGFISPQSLTGCTESVTWVPSVWGACALQQQLLASVGGVCKYLASMVASTSGTSLGFNYGCPEGMRCCMKRSYNGTYPVTVTVPSQSVGPGCSLSATVTGSMNFSGVLGACE
jgi:RHS repeat-associated protein